jgi:hypothetical protein
MLSKGVGVFDILPLLEATENDARALGLVCLSAVLSLRAYKGEVNENLQKLIVVLTDELKVVIASIP